MTREEAAKICQSIKFILDNDDYSEEVEEALDMAIEALQQEPKQRHWVDTPKEFAEKMYQLAGSGDEEADHVKADELMCQLLTSLGYGEGIKIFRDMDKWYS